MKVTILRTCYLQQQVVGQNWTETIVHKNLYTYDLTLKTLLNSNRVVNTKKRQKQV